jgi:hypothetical protein
VRGREGPGLVCGVDAAIGGKPFERVRSLDGGEPALDGLQHHVANHAAADAGVGDRVPSMISRLCASMIRRSPCRPTTRSPTLPRTRKPRSDGILLIDSTYQSILWRSASGSSPCRGYCRDKRRVIACKQQGGALSSRFRHAPQMDRIRSFCSRISGSIGRSGPPVPQAICDWTDIRNGMNTWWRAMDVTP